MNVYPISRLSKLEKRSWYQASSHSDTMSKSGQQLENESLPRAGRCDEHKAIAKYILDFPTIVIQSPSSLLAALLYLGLQKSATLSVNSRIFIIVPWQVLVVVSVCICVNMSIICALKINHKHM